MKQGYFLLRNDPEALIQARQFFLIFLVCIMVLWAGSTLFIEPKEKLLQQKVLQLRDLSGSIPDEMNRMMTAREKQLTAENHNLAEKIDLLRLKRTLLHENWLSKGDSDRFNRIIFTLNPDAPVNIENSLTQVSLQEKRSKDGFMLYPTTIEGEGSFSLLFDYLQYLESQPEVGLITELTIERPPDVKYFQVAPVHFSLVVSRVTLK
ncbi:MAG: hypothetical protein U9R66_05160 [Thermodesulfobacteriota bacterium]|nr:hypothetical protein [Thermodesulfobacteriota bacterium]